MSEPKFTSGPWSGNNHWHVYQPPNGRLVCVLQTFNDTFTEDKANMHLIAAAPEMYAALEAIINNEYSYYIPSEYHDAARAALRKARGEA